MTDSNNELIRALRPGDRDFLIASKITVTPRAGFEISKDCPQEYLQVLRVCLNNEWIKPVAYIKDSELAWEMLQS